MKELLEVIRDTLQKEQKEAQKLKREKLRARRLQSSTNLMKAPQWQL